MAAVIVLTSCPQDVATEIARNLVHQKLAAGVNIIPHMQSIYRWQDAVEENKESLLIIKTTQEKFEILEKSILAIHPYELPEILAIPINQASSSYLNWLTSSCIE